MTRVRTQRHDGPIQIDFTISRKITNKTHILVLNAVKSSLCFLLFFLCVFYRLI